MMGAVTIAPTVPSGPSGAQPPIRNLIQDQAGTMQDPIRMPEAPFHTAGRLDVPRVPYAPALIDLSSHDLAKIVLDSHGSVFRGGTGSV